MHATLTKERVLFLLGILLLTWVAVRLGFFAPDGDRVAGQPTLAAYSFQRGDPRIADALAMPPLSSYLGPGDPFRLDNRGPRVRVARRPLKPEVDWVSIVAELDSPRGRPNTPGKIETAGAIVRVDPVIKIPKRTGPWIVTVPPSPSVSPLGLIGTLRAGAGGASEWALLRNRGTRAILSGTVGDMLPGAMRLDAIRDDGATLTTPQGTRITLPGRFAGDGQR